MFHSHINIDTHQLYAQLGSIQRLRYLTGQASNPDQYKNVVKVSIFLTLLALAFWSIFPTHSWLKRMLYQQYNHTMQQWSEQERSYLNNWQAMLLKHWHDQQLADQRDLIAYLQLPRSQHVQSATETYPKDVFNRSGRRTQTIQINLWQDATPDIIQRIVRKAEAEIKQGLLTHQHYQARSYRFGEVAIMGDQLQVTLEIDYIITEERLTIEQSQRFPLNQSIALYQQASPPEIQQATPSHQAYASVNLAFNISVVMGIILFIIIVYLRHDALDDQMVRLDHELRTQKILKVDRALAKFYRRWLSNEIKAQADLLTYLSQPHNLQHNAALSEWRKSGKSMHQVRLWEDQPQCIKNILLYLETYLFDPCHHLEEETLIIYPPLQSLSTFPKIKWTSGIDIYGFYRDLPDYRRYRPLTYTFSTVNKDDEQKQLLITFVLDYGIENAQEVYQVAQQLFTLQIDLYHLNRAKRYLNTAVTKEKV